MSVAADTKHIYVVKTGRDPSWWTQLYVKPRTLRAKIALRLRGYRPIPGVALVSGVYWYHPKYLNRR